MSVAFAQDTKALPRAVTLGDSARRLSDATSGFVALARRRGVLRCGCHARKNAITAPIAVRESAVTRDCPFTMHSGFEHSLLNRDLARVRCDTRWQTRLL